MSQINDNNERSWKKFVQAVENKQLNINSPFGGNTALITIILREFDDKETKIKWLLENQADTNICNAKGISPLIFAIDRGNIEILKLLISYNVDLNKADMAGNIALHWAINQLSSSDIDRHKQYLEITKLLAENGANALALNHNYFNAIERIADKLDPLNPMMADKLLKQSYQAIYDLMHKNTFPAMYQNNMPDNIHTLLTGHRWKTAADNEPIKITYSIEAYNFDINSCLGKKINLIKNGSTLLNGSALNIYQSRAIKDALEHFSSVINIKFIEVPASSVTNLFFRQTSLTKYSSNVPARTDLCLNSHGEIAQTSITLDERFMRNPFKDYRSTHNQLNKIIKHEIAHALGLKHAEDYPKNDPTKAYMFTETIMSYGENNQPLDLTYPETIMPNDYEALSFLYSQNLTHNIEDNIYFIDASNFHLLTIFDQGGRDTIDASSYQGDALINLQTADPKADYDMSQVGICRFRIARDAEIENVKGSQGNNNITDNNSNNEIDLSHSNGDSIIRINKGDDNLKLSHGTNSIIFTADSSGHKQLSGFKPKIDKISFESYVMKREDMLDQDGSTIIKINNLEILFENTLVNYEDLIIVGENSNISFDHSEL